MFKTTKTIEKIVHNSSLSEKIKNLLQSRGLNFRVINTTNKYSTIEVSFGRNFFRNLLIWNKEISDENDYLDLYTIASKFVKDEYEIFDDLKQEFSCFYADNINIKANQKDLFVHYLNGRIFFDNAVLKPSFISEAIERSNILTKELEEYWKYVGKLNILSYEWSLETDITKWALRFACDMITIVFTGERSYSMASYYNILSNKKVKNSNTAIEDPERFIQGIKNHLSGFTYFLYFSTFLRHHIPFIKDQVKATLKNRGYLFKILDLIIKKRRKEIEEIPVGDELRNDMLTSLIVTNTVRDINRTNNGRDNISRPMTDDEIRANLLDSFQGGIDTVSRLHPIVIELQRYVTNPCEIAGHRFETGTVIHINTNGIHTHKDYWTNPEIFDPNRFYKN
ncbi:cytochrome P450 [Gigaspora rosea]|uniref:Cytochrome P450 n=1 Tax=Gigaspora rosea TaxID=44941 RepID=A0A397WA45_9GLOM|nr:cytochrome P450 [Gigaspora rosea]